MTSASGTGDGDGHEPLPRTEFAFPGPLREQLVAAILDGTKTATASLLREYEHEGEALPVPGARSAVVDSADVPVAVIEITGVRIVPLAEVDDAHARDEGEGCETAAAWRTAHETYWHSSQMRGALGDLTFTVDDATTVVLERFQLIEDLRPR